MRSTITTAMALCVLGVSAQEEGTGVQVASVLSKDTGGSPAGRWSGSGRAFTIGQPIEPVSLRAVTWEFGDGSLSNILPPRPWRSSDGASERVVPMAPLREHNGGSPCVAASEEIEVDADAVLRPRVIFESGVPVLVNTGLEGRYLAVRMIDPIRGGGALLERGFSSGRWAFTDGRDDQGPRFITLQDLATGERWSSGAAL